MRWMLVGCVLVVSCNRTTDGGGVATTTVPTAVTPVSSAARPNPSGLGRVADLPGTDCPRDRPSAPLDGDATISGCTTDAECTDGTNGRCIRLSHHGGHGPSLEGTVCSYDACFADADCDPRSACYCAPRRAGEPGTGHVCASGECGSDAECGAGRYCRRGPSGRYCHSPADQCVEETDCGGDQVCTRSADAVYRCAPTLARTG